jgi:hypothetical protein
MDFLQESQINRPTAQNISFDNISFDQMHQIAEATFLHFPFQKRGMKLMLVESREWNEG